MKLPLKNLKIDLAKAQEGLWCNKSCTSPGRQAMSLIPGLFPQPWGGEAWWGSEGWGLSPVSTHKGLLERARSQPHSPCLGQRCQVWKRSPCWVTGSVGSLCLFIFGFPIPAGSCWTEILTGESLSRATNLMSVRVVMHSRDVAGVEAKRCRALR